jgi:hypothetical protein
MPLFSLLKLCFQIYFFTYDDFIMGLVSLVSLPNMMFYCFTVLYSQNEGNGLYTGDGSVDFKGKPVLKKNTGLWKACPFILGDQYIVLYSALSIMYAISYLVFFDSW